MRPEELRKLLRSNPFEPLYICLSDSRCVIVRHPDQVVVAERHLLIGLAKLEGSTPLATPKTSSTIAKDWLIINLLQITTIEPGEDTDSRRAKRKGR